jgi:hypothetical protein
VAARNDAAACSRSLRVVFSARNSKPQGCPTSAILE